MRKYPGHRVLHSRLHLEDYHERPLLLYLTRYGDLVYYFDKIAVIDIGSKVFASGMS